MRRVRVREMLFVIALVAIGLGWAIDHARLARDSSSRGIYTKEALQRLSASKKREFALGLRVVGLERALEAERRKLAECEEKQAEGEE